MKIKIAIAGLALILAGCQSATDASNDSSYGQDVKAVKTASTMDQAQLTSTFYFAYDKAGLDDTSKKLLQAHAEFLNSHPEQSITIAGHTDARGTKEYNQSLGQRRANAIASFLKEQGVSQNQIKTVSFGKEHPLTNAENDQAQALNRRAEINYAE
jgi:peptidoglycan-associated lipoprotein